MPGSSSARTGFFAVIANHPQLARWIRSPSQTTCRPRQEAPSFPLLYVWLISHVQHYHEIKQASIDLFEDRKLPFAVVATGCYRTRSYGQMMVSIGETFGSYPWHSWPQDAGFWPTYGPKAGQWMALLTQHFLCSFQFFVRIAPARADTLVRAGLRCG